MRIEVYCLANNEEKLLPYYIRHYSQFAHVIVLNNNSTDRTVEIAKSLGAEVRHLNIPDELNDQLFIEIRNQIWKGTTADWIMWADADEFIYHPDLVDILSTTSATAILPAFYNMYSEVFPTTEGQIYEEVKLGALWGGEESIYGKVNIFKMPDIIDINYNPGCHRVNLKGNVILDKKSGIKTLHMRNVSLDFVLQRNARNSVRLSALNRKLGYGLYVDKPREELTRLFYQEMSEATIII